MSAETHSAYAQTGRDEESSPRDLNLARPEWKGLQMGPRAHMHQERERLAGLSWKHFDVRRVGSTLGAELHGVDLRDDLPDAVFAEIEQALFDYKVIFFRGQPLDPGQHVRFARRFGELELHPFIPPNEEHPELCRFEKSAEIGGYENLWHHDVTWRERPSKLAVLHAV